VRGTDDDPSGADKKKMSKLEIALAREREEESSSATTVEVHRASPARRLPIEIPGWDDPRLDDISEKNFVHLSKLVQQHPEMDDLVDDALETYLNG
jgi:hypothetical protein